MPKSGGAGLMISAFQSREFGWGFELTADQLKKINEKRFRDGDYFNKVAAKDMLNRTKKHELTESPFIRKLWYGSNNKGYWTGNHTIAQLEDCMDCLKVLYGDEFEFVFLPVVGVDAVEVLQDRINLLTKVNATEDGYQLVIPMVMTDKKTDCVSSHNKFTTRHKALFLISAYEKALEENKSRCVLVGSVS